MATDLAVGAAQPKRAGAASALSETSAEFGGALGIAILGVIGTGIYLSQLTAACRPGSCPEPRRPRGIPDDCAEGPTTP